MNKKDGEIIIYETSEKNISIDVNLKGFTIWLDQKSISFLFGVNIAAISKHIKNIYQEKE